MAKIRRMTILDINKIARFTDYINSANFYKSRCENFLPLFPLTFFHALLPYKLKFLKESYVAVEEGDILGAISLIPDGMVKTRWKISSLLLNENTKFASSQMIDFAVNKYGGIGVEIFLAIVDEKDPEIINIFKDACGFRSCARIQIWKKTDLHNMELSYNPEMFHDFEDSYLDELVEINTRNLFTQFRPTLIKNKNDFKRAYMPAGKNDIFKILFVNNKICGYFKLFSKNNDEFWLDAITSEPYIEYYSDIIGYVTDFILKKNKNAVLHVYKKKYRVTSQKLAELLEQNNFAMTATSQVLVKDYWKPIKVGDENEEKSFMFFKDMTSPACFQSSDATFQSPIV